MTDDNNTLVGPDRISPASSFTATEPDGAVKLRTDAIPPDDYPPVSVPTLLRRCAQKGGDHLALAVKQRETGKWKKWSYREYLSDVEAAARAFIKLGLVARHGVAIIGFNSPEWFLADLAAVMAGGMAAGIYPTSSSEACRYIMENCRANILVVEDEKQLAKFQPFLGELTHLKAIVQYAGGGNAEKPSSSSSSSSSSPVMLSWQELIDMGRQESDDALNDRLRDICINQCCHLVYTSGTTGPPKGVMLSHDNLTFTSRRLCEIFNMKEKEERLVSYLPLSHVAANICDIFVMLTSVGSVYFADKNALKGTLTETLREALPTLFFGVPRVWEKIHERMQEVGRQNKGLKQQIGNWAKKAGLEHNRNILNGGAAAGGGVSLKYKIANTLVFQKVKCALGLNKCLRFYAAAAPIAKEVLEYFMSLDMRILEIYGMSECSGPQLSNTYENQKIGTIGKELAGFHNKVKPLLQRTEDEEVAANNDMKGGGEICARGRHVMMGYLFNETKTAEAFDEEGWLKSGDVGREDPDGGWVTITGRIKELIITAGGENIPPILIEDAIKRELPCLSNVMVIGDKRKFLSCLLTLNQDVDSETLEPQPSLASNALMWMAEIGSSATTVQEALVDEMVARAIQEGVDRSNASAPSSAQRVQKWVLLPNDFSVPGGELGPTLKMKRHVVMEKNSSRVEGIYT